MHDGLKIYKSARDDSELLLPPFSCSHSPCSETLFSRRKGWGDSSVVATVSDAGCPHGNTTPVGTLCGSRKIKSCVHVCTFTDIKQIQIFIFVVVKQTAVGTGSFKENLFF